MFSYQMNRINAGMERNMPEKMAMAKGETENTILSPVPL